MKNKPSCILPLRKTRFDGDDWFGPGIIYLNEHPPSFQWAVVWRAPYPCGEKFLPILDKEDI